MKISAKTDYACRALLELSLHWPSEVPMRIQTIAERQLIPIKFLTQILITLKQLGYTQSIRGKKGGYLLSQAPNKIKLSDVIRNLDQSGFRVVDDKNNIKNPHILKTIWMELDLLVIKAMDEITLEVICDRKRSYDKTVNFDI